jgi:hypothetical protein
MRIYALQKGPCSFLKLRISPWRNSIPPSPLFLFSLVPSFFSHRRHLLFSGLHSYPPRFSPSPLLHPARCGSRRAGGAGSRAQARAGAGGRRRRAYAAQRGRWRGSRSGAAEGARASARDVGAGAAARARRRQACERARAGGVEQAQAERAGALAGRVGAGRRWSVWGRRSLAGVAGTRPLPWYPPRKRDLAVGTQLQ